MPPPPSGRRGRRSSCGAKLSTAGDGWRILFSYSAVVVVEDHRHRRLEGGGQVVVTVQEEDLAPRVTQWKQGGAAAPASAH